MATDCMKIFSMFTPMAAALLPITSEAQENKPQRPNVIIVLTDDMGYSDLGCYGGEVETPCIDNLAANGLRWSQFYNNARSCPSRAVLMTGLYPHQAGAGWMACADMQYDGYQGYLNENCVTIAEVLGASGYETYMCGKWHLCGERHCRGEVKEYWPMGRGFDHFYGIPEGASNYFHARLVEDETRLPVTGDGFYLTDALSDKAVEYIGNHDYGEKPLFLYLAYNAPHWPLHALQEDIDKYVERYRRGWDVLREERMARQKAMGLFAEDVELSPRDSRVPAWDSLSPEEQHDFTMRMAVYAAQIDAVDRGIGRVVEALKSRGEFENTVIMIMDDNGACAEFNSGGKSKEPTGQADTYESYRINWANLSSTPYREYKHHTNEGGIASPLIVSWPDGIDSSFNGNFVREYGYFADIMATCVDVAGAEYPKRFNGKKIVPLEGFSLVPNFKGEETGRGMTFWEHEVNIAVRDGKWKLNIFHQEMQPIDLSKIELYDMEKDPTELHNLADVYPERAKAMLKAWDRWARRSNVYPLSTDGYGHRAQAFRRHINGTFDDNLADWGRVCSKNADVSFETDFTGTMGKGKCAHVEIVSTGKRPADAFMKWNFPVEKPMDVKVGFRYASDRDNRLYFRLEKQNDPADKSVDECVELRKKGGKFSTKGTRLEKGRYQLVFYLGSSEPGNIWIDDVVLDLKEVK